MKNFTYCKKIKEKLKYEEIIADFKQMFDKRTFWTIFVVGMLIHFVMYSNQLVAYDGYWHYGSFISKGWEISLGRFLLPFFDICRGTLVNSFITTIISITIMSLANIVLCDLLKIKKSFFKILSGLVLVAMPTFSLTLMYTYCADSYTFAFLFSVLAIYFLNKNKKVLSIIFIIATLGIYQAYLCVITTLFLIVQIVNIFEKNNEEKTLIKEKIIQIFTIIVGMILYYILLNIILKVLHLNITEYKDGNNVLSIATIKNIINSIKTTYSTFYKFYFSDDIVINSNLIGRKILNILAIAIIAINTVYLTIKNKTYTNKLKMIFMVLIIAAYPIFSCSIELIVNVEMNLLMSASMYLIYVILIKQIEMIEKYNVIKVISIVLIVISIWSYIIIDNATYTASYLLKNQMMALGNRIQTKLSEYETNEKIYVFGEFPFEVQNDNLLKLTYFDVTDINNWTWEVFLEDYIGRCKKSTLKEEYEDMPILEEIYEMPIFPKDGSIKLIDDILIIKIGN